ncbi:ABC transporter ATP-binding protein [Tuwongella immobilis]|uniref:ABC transporter domain-containing protein n=1 Tax=Tuwongella immobilis TaxID=692036 RepID=A0A6C2YMC1_9BACT|nr:ATP-binding cassette domain-containing protein [Tuwongella immobilis]VIP02461.1 abc atp-binding protein : ABC transporter, ATP-binding protein OS=Blastopirellula marina DSM 3645 GN=DSM3645_18881 PE=3 SV=1: ABC_tran [Tuwongella immobilis]VTS01469.1 abc atp-binding protein : ABC transporter, ATP-binding protein OS=Blastopirellula marina DSM 3645 GN=DSM3645_18881 PE=3 SV=1: ABC_tran [Tuwongella immobilis]
MTDQENEPIVPPILPIRPIIELEEVGVTFTQPVIRSISLQILPGQTVAVIGESGCGKTVLLKSIVGLVKPTTGTVRFEGRDIHSLSEAELIRTRLRMGFLFQGAALFDSLNVFENIAFGVRSLGTLPEIEIRERVRRCLLDVGLPTTTESKMPSEISGGMKKRVGLARALALNPDVMLYDEPTTGLDPIMTDVINELILRTRKARPITSIIVTHEMRTVHKVADRVVMFYPLSRLRESDPQILYDGPADQLQNSSDVRIRQFIEGEAGDRMQELQAST